MSETPSRTSMDYQFLSNGPIPLFDTQLRFLNDSFLSLFLERWEFVEISRAHGFLTLVESLVKLYKKIKSIDSFLDDRSNLTTTRHAWAEVRENVEREAHARQAFLATLNADVIQPLTNLKETQERTRKRIKEDLKDSGLTYQEYAEVTLPKLRQRYNRKFQEVEVCFNSLCDIFAGLIQIKENKRAAAAPTSPPPTSTTHPDYSGLRDSHPSRPTVTSPQPLRALDRRPSGSAPGGRNRSPSSGTAFSDFAKEGKKQLNQLIGLLDKGGSVRDGAGGRENLALRTVRAKRELDEADKEYRKGVHWLETLRLRRVKTLESGYNSLVAFVEEVGDTMKKILEKFTDNMTATYATQTQLYSHAHDAANKIQPEKDKSRYTAFIPKSLESAIPERTLYHNCMVGECNDLIFGFGLLDYATTKNLPEGEVPKIVKICVAEIDKRGLEAEGIYRVSGRHAIVQTMQHDVEKDEEHFRFSHKDDIFAVASLLKLYLRELPEPVFRFSLQDRIQHSEDLADHRSNNFILLRSKMRRLPPVHQATLKALVEHLARVASHSEKSKMDPKNLAIVFGGVIFGEDEVPKSGDLLINMQNFKDSLMEDLITNAHILFGDGPGDEDPASPNSGTTTNPVPPSNSPPLPPMPSEEPAPQYYGSKTTRVVPPSPIMVSPISLSATDDFSPALPTRPMSSIHPSARSPTKERMDTSSAGAPPLPPRPGSRSRRQYSPNSSVFETDASASQESFVRVHGDVEEERLA
ncbi:hypothetical protein V5O48_014204 [Marasmius crinis-equi]|uniref:Rho-GAP domain-containing protein n=1 Tax=Marasmius crinis-equi TaxID=585013 RepID=A0ABR3EYB7_9AGAR